MRFSLCSIALVMVSISGLTAITAQSDPFGICSCSNTNVSQSCCAAAKGTMSTDVCHTPDINDSVTAYRNCCTAAKGITKYKPGYPAAA